MDPKQFASLGQKILTIIPDNGIQFSEMINIIYTNENNNISRSDIKSAFLGLKTTGNIQLDEDGMVYIK